ncbi:MAG: hypothetical protein ACOY4K_11755 [Pseudomonadota bacterium]
MNKPALRFALISCGMLLLVAVAATIAHRTGYIDQDATTRILMVASGVMMAAYSSRGPKDSIQRTARGIAIQRFTGWAFVIASLAWIAIWLVAPVSEASVLAMAPVILAGVAVAVRCLLGRARAAQG